MVVTIVVIVGIIGIGVGILAFRSRTEKGIESGITSFRRELHALAPHPDEDHRLSIPERTPDEARGLTIMPDEVGDVVEDESVDDEAVGDDAPSVETTAPEIDEPEVVEPEIDEPEAAPAESTERPDA